MGLSKFITRRDPQEIRDLGINLNDFAPAREPRDSLFSGITKAVRRATPVQPMGIMDTRIIPEEYGLEPRDYGESELMESDTTTREGIMSKFNPLNALGFLTNIYTGGSLSNALTTSGVGKLLSNILEAGRDTPNYQYRTPGYEGRLIASDFYDPKTGLNRFDRAKTLFGQSRTMKDFLDALKEQRDRRAANRAAVQRAIQNQQDAGGSVQSSDDYSGVGDQGATGANFSGDFATDSASYDL